MSFKYDIINPSELKSKISLIDDLTPKDTEIHDPKDLFKEKERVFDPVRQLDLQAYHLKERMSAIVDYLNVNMMGIMDARKKDRITDVVFALDDEYEKCTEDAFNLSQEKQNEDIFILWKHYQFELAEIREKMESTFDRMTRISAVHSHIESHNKASHFNLNNYRKKLTISSIALLQIYNGVEIVDLDIKKLLSQFGQKNVQTFKQQYRVLINQDRRILFKNFEECCNEIIDLVDNSVKREILADIRKARSKKEARKK